MKRISDQFISVNESIATTFKINFLNEITVFIIYQSQIVMLILNYCSKKIV